MLIAWWKMKLKVSLCLFLVLSALLIVLPSVLSVDPERSDITSLYEQPSLAHLMGTDSLGRDLLVRILYGGQLSLAIGFAVSIISLAVGSFVGLYAGYYINMFSDLLMRLVDVFLALPYLFVLILLSVLLRETSITDLVHGTLMTLIVGLASVSWMTTARMTYALCIDIRTKLYIESARSLGATDLRIISRHIIPQLVGPLLVQMSLNINATILAEAGVSFIGFGIHPRTPTWGNLLVEGSDAVGRRWWLAIFPALTLFVFSITLGFLTDGLQEYVHHRS